MKKFTICLLFLVSAVTICFAENQNEEPAGSDYKPMLVPGRRWDYFHGGLMDYQHHTFSEYIDGYITGDNGVEYYVIKRTSDINDKIVGYMREINGKICRYNTPEERNGWRNHVAETLVYDFSLDADGTFTTWYFPSFGSSGHGVPLVSTVTVIENGETDKKGKKFKHQIFDVIAKGQYYLDGDYVVSLDKRITVLQEVGLTEGGTVSKWDCIHPLNNGDGPNYLMRVTDPDGTVIYYDQWAEMMSAGQIECDPAAADNRMYDLMGREIRDPQPGTVYIRNGKKYVMSTK